MAGIVVHLDCDALPDDRQIVDVRGVEAMNALPAWTVGFVTSDAELDLDRLTGAAATLKLIDEDEGSERSIPLLATDIAYEGATRDGHRFVVTLSAPEWLLTLRSGYRMFVDKSTPEIVAEVMRDAGVHADRLVWRLAGKYVKRPQCVQHGETDWELIERLLADEGISYWFDVLDDRGSVVVFGDSVESHDGIASPDVLPFDDSEGLVRPRGFYELEVEESMVPTSVHLRDFDVRQPDIYIEGTAGERSRWDGFDASFEGDDDTDHEPERPVTPPRRVQRPSGIEDEPEPLPPSPPPPQPVTPPALRPSAVLPTEPEPRRPPGDKDPLPAPAPAQTWFALRVVDEIGQPVEGVPIELDAGGATKHVTDATGTAHLDAAAGLANARVADVETLRKALAERWSKPRSGELPQGPEHHVVRPSEAARTITLRPETTATLVVQPAAYRARLVGMFFEPNKCFLLPSAMHGIKGIRRFYEKYPSSELLIVGHTDTEYNAQFNEQLSLERAKAVAAYLTDNADAWAIYFDMPDARRWAYREVQHMLSVLPTAREPYFDTKKHKVDGMLLTTMPALQAFQRAKGLKETGEADKATRKALLVDYMKIDGTTLPAGVTPLPHGCGEYFPAKQTGDNVGNAENRRVEMILFDGPIRPKPWKEISKPGSPEYGQWLKQIVETVDFDAQEPKLMELRVRLHDIDAIPMSNVAYKALVGEKWVSGYAPDGWATIPISADECTSDLPLEWGGPNEYGAYLFKQTCTIECDEVDERAQVVARLHNLGYPREMGIDAATHAFQIDHGVPERGLTDGRLPPLTKAKLWSAHEACDATRAVMTEKGTP